jgi:hypothetical protein
VWLVIDAANRLHRLLSESQRKKAPVIRVALDALALAEPLRNAVQHPEGELNVHVGKSLAEKAPASLLGVLAFVRQGPFDAVPTYSAVELGTVAMSRGWKLFLPAQVPPGVSVGPQPSWIRLYYREAEPVDITALVTHSERVSTAIAAEVYKRLALIPEGTPWPVRLPLFASA